MTLGQEEFLLGFEWARLHFTENKGMAFGLELGGNYGKLILSLFRIFAVGILIYIIRGLIKNPRVPLAFIFSLSLILAGAIGNIVDSVFYGMIFSASGIHTPATLFPEGGGYAPIFYGKVVDMFYFPLYDDLLPDWVPFWGGERFIFFRPVFNIADSAITVGVLTIIFFQQRFFREFIGNSEAEEVEIQEVEPANTQEEEVKDVFLDGGIEDSEEEPKRED